MALPVQSEGRELVGTFAAERGLGPGHDHRAQGGRRGAGVRPRHRRPRRVGKRSSQYNATTYMRGRVLFCVSRETQEEHTVRINNKYPFVFKLISRWCTGRHTRFEGEIRSGIRRHAGAENQLVQRRFRVAQQQTAEGEHR